MSVDVARELIDRSSRVVVLTGAGISTNSGIPDFRGPNGVWTKNPDAEKASNLHYYVNDPAIRKRSWQYRLGSGMWDAQPNIAHHALVHLEQRSLLHLLITQNVDGLHHKAGTDPDLLVEVHGNVRDVVCLDCDYRDPMAVALDRVRAGEEDPDCPDCGGILKSATISFGQSLVTADLVRADQAARSCDLMLAVGTSLTVSPICDVVPIAAHSGATVVILNAEPTPMDGLADVVINDEIADALPIMVGMSASPNC